MGAKPALIVWGAKTAGSGDGPGLPRLSAAFGDPEVLVLPLAGHYFQEEAPDEVAAAIRQQFG